MVQSNDIRYQLIRGRLETLSDEQIERIINDIDLVCLDEFNYDAGKCCLLAVGLGLHRSVKNPSNEIIQRHLAEYYTPVNVLKGVKGDFFTSDRKKDLLDLTQEILFERKCKLK